MCLVWIGSGDAFGILPPVSIPGGLRRPLLMCGLAAPVLFAIGVGFAARRYPGYSHLSQAISELGGVDAPASATLALAGFVLWIGLAKVAEIPWANGSLQRCFVSVLLLWIFVTAWRQLAARTA